MTGRHLTKHYSNKRVQKNTTEQEYHRRKINGEPRIQDAKQRGYNCKSRLKF
jgi:hypothetical protein